jgi:hypothetical protein
VGARVTLDGVTALAFDTPGAVRVHGLVSTSIDGSAFDAEFTWDRLAPGTNHPGGLLDAPAGGLRLVKQDVVRSEYVYVPTGDPGPGCEAAHVASPCLVPRVATLAHDRLRTQRELAATLAGHIEVDDAAPPVDPAREGAGTLIASGVVAALLVAVLAWWRGRATTPLSRVRSAARVALRALRGDPSQAALRPHIAAMVARAVELDGARRTGLRRLRSIDRTAIARRRAALPATAGAEATAWLEEESRETARLDDDVASSIAGMDRIESALRVVALRLREHRGVRVRARRFDPVDAAARELETRDQAIAETESTLEAPASRATSAPS